MFSTDWLSVITKRVFSFYTYAKGTVVVGQILNGKLCIKDGCVRFLIGFLPEHLYTSLQRWKFQKFANVEFLCVPLQCLNLK